jgi:DNA-binding NarL/FixJ family response regulator
MGRRRGPVAGGSAFAHLLPAARSAGGGLLELLGQASQARTDRARILIGRCEGAQSPALTLIDTPILTTREREVVTLAADGFSSPAIAKRMALSNRTVETHSRNAYAKLGIHSRDELPSVVGRRAGPEGPSST